MRSVIAVLIKLIQARRWKTFAAEDLRLNPVRHYSVHLILHMRTRGYSENVVKFCCIWSVLLQGIGI